MTPLLLVAAVGGSDPTSVFVGLLATQGVAVTLVAFAALALYKDKWGSNTERDRLRRVEDLVISEIVPNTQRNLILSDSAISATSKLSDSLERLERVTGELEALRLDLKAERAEVLRLRVLLAEKSTRDAGG